MNTLDVMKQALDALELSWVGNPKGIWDSKSVLFIDKAMKDLRCCIQHLEEVGYSETEGK